MTGRRVSLSSNLLQAALALPEETTAPADLRGSIAAAIMVTPQRPAPVRARIAAAFTVLPRPVRLAISALLLAALLVGLAAVGALLFPRPGVLGDSSTFRGDVARTGVVVGPGPGAKMSIGFRTTLGGQIVSSPAVVDRMAYIGAIDGTFRAFDLDRGREAWTAEVNVAWSSPSVAGDLVIVGSEDRELVALDRHTGAFAWRVPLDAFAAGSPAIHDGRIYVATSSEQSRGRSIPGATGKIVAIDLASHEILWQEDLPGPSTRSIAAQDSILVVPTDVGIAVAFDTGTGRELWRFSTEAFTDTPVIGGDKVYLAGLDLEGTRGSAVGGRPHVGREALAAHPAERADDPGTGRSCRLRRRPCRNRRRRRRGPSSNRWRSGLDSPRRRGDRILADPSRRHPVRGDERRDPRHGRGYGRRPGNTRDRRDPVLTRGRRWLPRPRDTGRHSVRHRPRGGSPFGDPRPYRPPTRPLPARLRPGRSPRRAFARRPPRSCRSGKNRPKTSRSAGPTI